MSSDSRVHVLERIRAALRDAPPAPEPARNYHQGARGDHSPRARVALLANTLADYRARVHRTTPGALPGRIAALLGEHGARSVLVPAGLPTAWTAQVGCTVLTDGPDPLPVRTMDGADAVLTGCALAVAETGTIVLDGTAGQGRRALSLLPDLHICVVSGPGQIVSSVPQALARLVPDRPLTWISGPSATSDIELQRVEGVHGPRTLEVIIVHDEAP